MKDHEFIQACCCNLCGLAFRSQVLVMSISSRLVPFDDKNSRPPFNQGAFVDFFFNKSSGILHLNWALDAFWGKVTREVFIPGLAAIHDKLVEKKQTKNSHCDWGDADGQLYFVPHTTRKIIVFTTQNRDYLFILTPMTKVEYFPELEDGKKIGKEYDSYSLHIRRIWRPFKRGDIWNLKKIMSGIKNAIAAADALSEYCDDHAEYPQRPSLAMYQKIDFDMDNFHDKPRFYGDMRDAGFILSSNDRFSMKDADSTKYSHMELEMIATCWLGVMASEMGVEIAHPHFG